MQRALIMMTVLLLVTAALGVGSLASHWPFWHRAWQWQTADGWPDALPGPVLQLHGGDGALPLQLAGDAALGRLAGDSTTRIVLSASIDGRGQAWFAPGTGLATQVDGRGLASGLLAPLYGVLAREHPGLLDAAASQYLTPWRGGRRGEITVRQLFWQLGGLPATTFRPLNPFSTRAQLASGPDFERAVLDWPATHPPGSHFEASPVNAQALAMVSARLAGQSYAQLLQDRLWSQLAADPAVAMLDHPRGNIAAHCCLRATAADWLRLGLLLAADGRIQQRQVLPTGFLDELTRASAVHPGYGLGYRLVESTVAGRLLALDAAGRQLLIAPATGRAVLWVGSGAPPQWLVQLLSAAVASSGDSPAAN
jgi:Beta-lactamase